jgi:hypothetical protein
MVTSPGETPSSQVLAESGRLQRRLRRLLARVTEFFILALTLFTSRAGGCGGEYAPGPVLIKLRISGDAVVVVAWDSDPVLPVARAADAGRVGQHGLEIVMAVAQGFEVQREPVGKRITARIALWTTQVVTSPGATLSSACQGTWWRSGDSGGGHIGRSDALRPSDCRMEVRGPCRSAATSQRHRQPGRRRRCGAKAGVSLLCRICGTRLASVTV